MIQSFFQTEEQIPHTCEVFQNKANKKAREQISIQLLLIVLFFLFFLPSFHPPREPERSTAVSLLARSDLTPSLNIQTVTSTNTAHNTRSLPLSSQRKHLLAH